MEFLDATPEAVHGDLSPIHIRPTERKLTMRSIILFAATLSLALATACAPSPRKVCEHVGELMEQEMSDEDLEECEGDLIQEIQEECGDKTNEALRCIMGADSREGMNDCEEICDDEE